MTRTERKLRKHLTEAEMACIECKTAEIEVGVDIVDGRADYEKSEELAYKAAEILGWTYGYRCGWNGWVFEKTTPQYIANAASADFCNPASYHHY